MNQDQCTFLLVHNIFFMTFKNEIKTFFMKTKLATNVIFDNIK